jgi:hypothetical protein
MQGSLAPPSSQCIVCLENGATFTLEPCSCTEPRYHVHCLVQCFVKGRYTSCGVCRGATDGNLRITQRQGFGIPPRLAGQHLGLAAGMIAGHLGGIAERFGDVGGAERTYHEMREFRLQWSSGFVILRKVVLNEAVSLFRTRAQWDGFAPAFIGFVELSLAVLRRIRPTREESVFEISLSNEFLGGAKVTELLSVMTMMDNTDMYINERLIDRIALSYRYQRVSADAVDSATPIFKAMYRCLVRDIWRLTRKT